MAIGKQGAEYSGHCLFSQKHSPPISVGGWRHHPQGSMAMLIFLPLRFFGWQNAVYFGGILKAFGFRSAVAEFIPSECQY